MKHYIEKFDKLIKGKQSIDIKFLDDDPLTVLYERNNQSGKICYCMEDETMGKQKVKNIWQPIECTTKCQYLQKGPNGKKACNRIAWLKFFIPEVSIDRLWLMKITSQEAIDNLKGYFVTQKLQGNSLKGIYTIFLYQKEQTDWQGKTHNNYLVDLVEKNTNIQYVTQQVNQNIEQSPAIQAEIKETAETTENKELEQQEKTNNIENKENEAESKENKRKSQIKDTKAKKAKTTQATIEATNQDKSDVINNETYVDYALLSVAEEIIDTPKGKKTYVVGEFCDLNDKVSKIIIKPEFANELIKCNMGTMVKLVIQEKVGLKFATELIYTSKLLKKEVA